MTGKHNLGEIEELSKELTALRRAMRREMAQYTRLSPWRTYWAIAAQWIVIAIAVAAAIYFNHPFVYLIAIVVIASRQHALGVLGHEGSHFRITPRRRLNDFVADFFCWLPVGFNNTRYGYEHILHHRFVNGDRDPYMADFKTDPQFWWPKSRSAAWGSFAQDLSGAHFARVFSKGNRWGPFYPRGVPLSLQDKHTAAAFYLLLLVGLWLSSGWWYFLLLWLLPLVTVTWWIIHFRTVAEHLGIDKGASGLAGTRHVNGTRLEQLFLCPCNINYHLAHHLFPAVPWYHLPALHRRLMQEPAYRDCGQLRRAYFGEQSVWQEVVNDPTPGAQPTAQTPGC